MRGWRSSATPRLRNIRTGRKSLRRYDTRMQRSSRGLPILSKLAIIELAGHPQKPGGFRALCTARRRIGRFWSWIAVILGVSPCFRLLRTDSSHGCPALMEDQAIKVVGDVGKRQFCLGPRQADGADEQAVARFLACEDMLDGGRPPLELSP